MSPQKIKLETVKDDEIKTIEKGVFEDIANSNSIVIIQWG